MHVLAVCQFRELTKEELPDGFTTGLTFKTLTYAVLFAFENQ